MKNQNENTTHKNEHDVYKKLLKLSKQNLIALDNTRTFFTNKKKDNPEAEALVASTKYEIYEILSEKSPDERLQLFDSFFDYCERMMEACQLYKLRSGSLIDLSALLSFRMDICRNVESVYYETLMEHFIGLASRALWENTEIDYQNDVEKIRESLSNLAPEEINILKNKITNHASGMQKKAEKTLKTDEYALAEQETKACRLLFYVTAEMSTEGENVHIHSK